MYLMSLNNELLMYPYQHISPILRDSYEPPKLLTVWVKDYGLVRKEVSC